MSRNVEERVTMDGQMLWFNEAKGFGFIRTAEEERLYVEAGGFAGGVAPPPRCAGMTVTFARDGSTAPARAVEVVFPPAAAQGRARFRGRGGSMRRVC
jgi:hypothetical protein